MIFSIVRVMIFLLGILMIGWMVGSIVVAFSDGEWGAASLSVFGGIVGVWLVRVAFHGTFSGEAEKAHASPVAPPRESDK